MGWTKLRLGMSFAQADLTLGEPLIRTAGQGFEIGIYDRNAEVVFYGPLVGWTSPGTDACPGAAVDVWQIATAQSEAGLFFPPARSTARPPADPTARGPTVTFCPPIAGADPCRHL